MSYSLLPRSLMRVIAVLGFVLGQSSLVYPQPSSRLEFDVAVIKRSDPSHRGVQTYFLPDGFTAKTAPLKNLICFAYAVREHQVVVGADWEESEPFDISAKADGPRTYVDMQKMVQALLTERFRLKFHREVREQSIYLLTQDKRGSKLRDVPSAGRGVGMGGQGRLNGIGADTPTLASALSGVLGRSVVDRTELKGFYDFVLTWTPDEVQVDAPGPSLFTAIQDELGLKLVSSKGPVDVLVIDGAERASGN